MLARVGRLSTRAVATGRVASARKIHTSVVAEEQGKIKWFNAAKGFGFISREDGQDIFVHHTAVQGEGFKILNEGDQVEFETQNNGEKIAAANVTVIQTSVTQAQRDAFAERSNARREMMGQRRESSGGRGGFRGRGRGGFRGGRGGSRGGQREGEQREQQQQEQQ
eukprot:TRINITY_DN314_c0_g2_i1.p4 TRINITY_DN314_c0_g2~~TRINITY_DN314_c0_g2_i1.p4  ORF type:complete len:166 (+),score=60.83 TRINITY_DN314_c0_g2_i1:876-1373(+)